MCCAALGKRQTLILSKRSTARSKRKTVCHLSMLTLRGKATMYVFLFFYTCIEQTRMYSFINRSRIIFLMPRSAGQALDANICAKRIRCVCTTCVQSRWAVSGAAFRLLFALATRFGNLTKAPRTVALRHVSPENTNTHNVYFQFSYSCFCWTGAFGV